MFYRAGRQIISRVAQIFCGALLLCGFTASVSAQEITAIDFNGSLLGKVIPDGKVVGFDNQLIGNVTADSLILNFDGKLIGGVVPQGVAIGNDAKLLGKVNNDGSVRLASGQVIGRVLPNGLVINDYFDVIGAVLFPGLVYSDEGKTVGRVTGDGYYTNLQGQQIGIVTPDGYAYRQVGGDYILDGRLISSKMIVSMSGEFIGSVVPGGGVSGFDSQIIGQIKANGYAYDDQNQIIGHIVKSGYAFDNNGYYMGFVTYNGEVIENEKLVGHIGADGNILDLDGNNIGYSVNISATATDLQGKYLGRLLPDGNLARARDVTALVGARGTILAADGRVIGQIAQTGPVFDYKGTLRGHALPNGTVITLAGTQIGYMVDNYAYDLSGRIIGAVLKNYIVYGNDNEVWGITGVNSVLNSSSGKKNVSPFGFVFNQEGDIVGSSFALAPVYNAFGNVSGQVGFDGFAKNNNGNVIGTVLASGYMSADSRLSGRLINALFAVSEKGELLGHLSQQNAVVDSSMNVVGKILPDDSVIKTDDAEKAAYMPVSGQGLNARMVLNFVGKLLGYVDINGTISDLSGAQIGRVNSKGWALDNNGIVIGRAVGFNSVINGDCNGIGVLSAQGVIQNYRGIYIGKMLVNGQALSDAGNIIGFTVKRLPVIDFFGNTNGIINADGRVRNLSNQTLGCVNKQGQLRDADNIWLASMLDYSSVMDFRGNIIGRSILEGSIVNEKNVVIGYQQADGNVNSEVGNPLGNMFKYAVAFDLDNKFMGLVNDDGSVFSQAGKNEGKVGFDGYVLSGGQKIGYALYDFYIYDADNNAIGYISRKGDVVNFNNQNMGVIDRGFLVDKDKKVIGRGLRDYKIRDKNNVVLGELSFDGKVFDHENQEVGSLEANGNIVNRNNEVIAQASPLQYHSNISGEAKRKMVFDKDGNFIGYLDENGNVVDANGNIIGVMDENGNLVSKNGAALGEVLKKRAAYDKDGNLIGHADEDGRVLDKDGKLIGKIDESGNVVDGNGNILGGINANWYERAPVTPPTISEKEVSPALELLESKQFRKSLGVALTPDGEYLGEIMEDGSVVDEDGYVLGNRMPDGLIIDDDGALIGIEEVKKPDTSGMFVPPGTFGDGGAYGTGAGAAGNLGPGGGYGPGERYDPARQAALNTAMSERRKNISVGKISNGVRKEAFDGMQKDWSEQGIGKVISSWRVDLSEMIFADKPIPAVIARAIDSNNPAPITAFVERNVYAEEGRNVIIPAGSRLMGSLGGVTASSEATSESARVQISWERLIRPDGSLFVFQGLTADAQGRAGALGYVDQQLFKKYTLPVMTTTLTSATSYFMAPKDNNTGDSESPRQQAANDARQNFLNEMNKVFDEILADKSNIKPMTYIPAGTRIIVFPMSDLWLRTVERDQDASINLEKPTIFLDDGEAAASREGHKRDNLRQRAVAANDSDVVYSSGGDEDVEAVKAAPLIEGKKKPSNNNAAASNPNYIAPPPPPSPSGAAASGNNNNNNNGVPALF